MRLAAPLLALLVLAASLAPAAAAQTTYSIDATLRVLDADTARLESTYTYTGGRTSWVLHVPPGGAFLDATDASGRTLDARTDDGRVTLTTPGGTHYAFTVRFRVPVEDEGPYHRAAANVAAAATSRVTVRVALPAGWSVAGHRDNGADGPYEGHAFLSTGPALVEYLLLPAPLTDAPPAEPTTGARVVRSALAHVSPERVRVGLDITYDTDHYAPTWRLLLGGGATGISASTPYGPVPIAPLGGDSYQVQSPYPSGWGLGARTLHVRYDLPAPSPHGGPFVRTNVSVAAGTEDVVRLRVTHDDTLRPTGWRAPDARPAATGIGFDAVGPLTVSAAFLPPPAPGHVQFTEGSFVVDVPQERAEAARAIARNVSAQLARAAPWASPADLARPFFVAYTDADVFGWEEGFYTRGLNTISIRLSDLDGATAEHPALGPASTLVHETAHGLADRVLAGSDLDVSLLDEGLARLAETRLEEHFPDQVVACTRTGLRQECTIESARIDAERLRQWHRDGHALPVGWDASGVDADTRAFLYDYSGLVFNLYDRRAPAGALRAVLVNLSRQAIPESTQAQADLVVATLLAHAPGTSREALLYPGRAAAAFPSEEFRYCMQDLVAPGYPWSPSPRVPPGGCPATGYGGPDAPLPPPPPPTDDKTAAEEPVAPSPTPSPRPLPTPTRQGALSPPEDDDLFGPAGDDADAPPPISIGGDVAVPGPGAALALAAGVCAALAWGRRQRRA